MGGGGRTVREEGILIDLKEIARDMQMSRKTA
jgi:hypothetical protein